MAYTKEFSYAVEGDGRPMTVTRKEYIRFQQMVSGKMLRPLFWVTLVGMLLVGASQLTREYLTVGLAVMGAVLVVYLAAMAIMAVLLVRRWGKAYDDTVASGLDFYGHILVTSQGVEKRKNDFTLAISLDSNSLVLEDESLFVVMNRRRQAILLPARYLTAAEVTILRQAPGYRPGKKRLTPGGEVAVPPPAEQRQVAFEGEFVYTPEEFVAVRKEQITTMFWKRAPVWGLLAMAIGMTIGIDSPTLWPAVLTFLLALGLLMVFNWVIPLRQVGRLAEQALPEEARRGQFVIDSRGVRMTAPGQAQGGTPWTAVRHVYDGELIKFDCRQGAVYLPRRCVAAVAVFSADLDNFRKR